MMTWNEIPFDKDRIMKLWMPRLYKDQLLGGLRELVDNAIDYGAKKGRLYFRGANIIFENNSKPFNDPSELVSKFLHVASPHSRPKSARGIFGAGAKTVAALSERAFVTAYINGQMYKLVWELSKYQWLPSFVPKIPPTYTFAIEFQNVKESHSTSEIRYWLRSRFSIRMKYTGFRLYIDDELVDNLLPPNFQYVLLHDKKGNAIQMYLWEALDGRGKIYWCTQGTAVLEQSNLDYNGFINADHLETQVNKEDFVSSQEWRDAKEIVAKKLKSLVRPKNAEDFWQRIFDEINKIFGKDLGPELSDRIKPFQKREPVIHPDSGTHDATKKTVTNKEDNKTPTPKSDLIKTVEKDLAYPFVYYELSSKSIVFNTSHPICRNFHSLKAYSIMVWQGRPFISRINLVLQYIKANVSETVNFDIFTKADVEFAKRLKLI